jgi:FkbM family methyltransferase
MMLSRFTGPTGLVVGVDLIAENVMSAQSTAFINGAANIKIRYCAVGEHKGQIGIANELNGYVATDSRLQVRMTTCDELDAELGPFNVLKVDVEGYEVNVLKGAKTLLSRQPKLIIEIHSQAIPRYGVTVDELIELIAPDRYSGKMLCREERAIKDFRPVDIPTDGIANVFLVPR